MSRPEACLSALLSTIRTEAISGSGCRHSFSPLSRWHSLTRESLLPSHRSPKPQTKPARSIAGLSPRFSQAAAPEKDLAPHLMLWILAHEFSMVWKPRGSSPELVAGGRGRWMFSIWPGRSSLGESMVMTHWQQQDLNL